MGALLAGRVLLRRETLSWIPPLLILAQFSIWGLNLPFESLRGLLFAAVLLAALRSGGVLSLATAFFVYTATSRVPITLAMDRWYSESSMIVTGLIVALATVAARVSMGRGPVLQGTALD